MPQKKEEIEKEEGEEEEEIEGAVYIIFTLYNRLYTYDTQTYL